MRRSRSVQPLVLVFFCALLSTAGLSQSSAYKPGAPLLMWKVSSKTNSAYVLGSVHLGDKSMYPLPAVVENAFNAASVLIVEVNMLKVDPRQMQQLMAATAIYSEGDDLFKHITPETREKLAAFLVAYGMPPEVIARFRPWAVGVTVSLLPLMKSGLDPKTGLDMYFLQKADSKRIEQLEDPAWQLKLLASEVPENDSDKFLSSCIKDAESAKEKGSRIAALWSEGSAEKLDEYLSRESPDQKTLSRRLREDRNPHMTDQFEKCLQSSESCFMVVGAAHVVGREGIVNQLKTRGYRVEQALIDGPAISERVAK
ncbi:MAG TPA: TraB/GumN family protein [Candidatus Saccharimonadales bacterium]|nr:TraB/GumN family protein [Candidatus Saccharimonadales bacterium]